MSLNPDLDKVKSAYERLFKTPNGKIVMRDLRSRYMDKLLINPNDEFKDIAIKSSKHDVIQSIINMATPVESKDG